MRLSMATICSAIVFLFVLMNAVVDIPSGFLLFFSFQGSPSDPVGMPSLRSLR